MKIDTKFKMYALSLVANGFLVGCGSSDSTQTVDNTTVGTAVDPYISGAKFFYDENNNGIKDSGEAVSTLSDVNGEFTFAIKIPDGGVVRMDPDNKGIHNGVAFTGLLAAKLSSSGVVSPLTTLGAKGYTNTEIVNLLATAGITITEDDINKNPMAELSNSTITTANSDAIVKRIQANVAVNTFLNIAGYNLDKTAISGQAASLTKAANLIKASITKEQLEGANAGVVLKTAIAISDYLVSKTATDGNTNELDDFISDTSSKRTNAINTLVAAYTNDNTKIYRFNGTSVVATGSNDKLTVTSVEIK